MQDNYLNIVYSHDRKPISRYPSDFADLLSKKYFKGTSSLLDVGCGRGDMMHALADIGYVVSGIDGAVESIPSCEPYEIKILNLEESKFPYDPETFQFVLSKSVIEHLNNPLHAMKEIYRVLQPGGKAVILTPSWLHTGWGPFYIDYTHVSPFTSS